jgi:2-polyprenyl-3-methyl-5-hydroxy-6-metoxy-1,4-benzoquinol methylase
VADELFEHSRLAAVHDALDPDRSDLDAYVAIVAELGAQLVLDVGCGTGTFALMLVERGVGVVGVDPAGASLDVARGKPGGGKTDRSQLPIEGTGGHADSSKRIGRWR